MSSGRGTGGSRWWWPLALVLAAQAALPAPALGEATLAPRTSAPERPPRRPAFRGGRAGLEGRVATLTRALGLDREQQAALRRALLAQRQQVERIWRDGSVPAADRIAATRQVSLRTSDRIRAFLNEEQRRKYDPPPPSDAQKASGAVSVEDWMRRLPNP